MVQIENISMNGNEILVLFTPTIPHCSMASVIGLSIRLKLQRSLPKKMKLDVRIVPGTHVSEASLNKQFNDKERVCAALSNVHLMNTIQECLKTSYA